MDAFDREFVWATGIEDTFVPQTRPGHRALDEYELIDHYRHWRTDLALAREVGASAVRWGIPWYRVEPSPGEFDWSWTDQVIPYIVEELGLTPIIDLMHYGCPLWLTPEFISPSYPGAVARYAGAFARRYRDLVRVYTPLNEPLMNALMCGERSAWPPYLRGETGYVRIMTQLALGIQETVRAVQTERPDALMVHVEAAGLSRAASPDLEPLRLHDELKRFLSLDLVTGRVTGDHPLYPWLLRNRVSAHVLRTLQRDAIPLDILGLNFYPQWSTHELHYRRNGRLGSRTVDHEGLGFGDLIRLYQRRYGAPVMITETSAHGGDEVKCAWLSASVSEIRRLRADGVPVIGYTWFPLTTMVDWRYRHGKGPVEEYRVELGAYRLSDDPARRWEPTRVAEMLRSYATEGLAPAGRLEGDGQDNGRRAG